MVPEPSDGMALLWWDPKKTPTETPWRYVADFDGEARLRWRFADEHAAGWEDEELESGREVVGLLELVHAAELEDEWAPNP